MRALFQQLVDLHRSLDARAKLGFLEDRLVRDPTTGMALWESYIPFLGPSYECGGLFLVGTAQSLAKVARNGSDFRWRLATGLPERPLYRLYRVGQQTVDCPLSHPEVSFESIAIQPYMDGIFAGIGGAALVALGWGVPDTLDTVTQQIAVTNFFKHSLQDPRGNDLNPLQLPKDIHRAYQQVILRDYVLEEIKILQPRVVIAFSRQIADDIRQAWQGGRVYGINDPA